MAGGRQLGAGLLAALGLLAACAKKPETLQTADLSIYMPAAFKTAFGAQDTAPHDVTIKGKPVTMQFSPHLLVDIGGNRAALISTGASADCQDCGGAIAVHYMQRDNGEFRVVGQWFDLAPSAGSGDPPTAQTRTDLFDHTALQLEAVDRMQGCTFSTANVYELEPTGPALRAKDIVMMRDNIAMGALRRGVQVDDYANVLPEKKGRSFLVQYHGTLPGDLHFSPGPNGVWTSVGNIKLPDCWGLAPTP